MPIGELLEERRHLLDVACWMLGSGPAAERVIDETYRQWYELSEPARERITAPRSWLARVAGGICLSRLALPEQVTEVLLEAVDSLSPAERALFVLGDVPGDVPGMAGGGIADIVRQRGPASAGPASAGPTERAGESLRARRARPTPPEQRDLLAVEVCRACVTQDETLLVSVLAPDVTAFFDGGGKVRALVKPVHGATQVARSLLALLARR
ncbi:RNA polymerase subunit sigma, partial [Streptomyces sp. NPDC005820]|uniref:RNA polymerase subunit sigma n=1 Tax=Streptomyces sp. NPDC005820 TaxID=3157069 RepID=UPI0033F738E4